MSVAAKCRLATFWGSLKLTSALILGRAVKPPPRGRPSEYFIWWLTVSYFSFFFSFFFYRNRSAVGDISEVRLSSSISWCSTRLKLGGIFVVFRDAFPQTVWKFRHLLLFGMFCGFFLFFSSSFPFLLGWKGWSWSSRE